MGTHLGRLDASHPFSPVPDSGTMTICFMVMKEGEDHHRKEASRLDANRQRGGIDVRRVSTGATANVIKTLVVFH